MLFTDESRFSLVSDRPVLVPRRKGEGIMPECLNDTAKFGGGGIIVRGGFCAADVGEFYLCDGSIKTHQYLDIMKGPMKRSLVALLSRRNAIL